METTADDFRILSLRRDRDALLLIGVSLVLVVMMLAALAFLPDAAWSRLVDRSKAMYAVGVALLPTVIAVWRRYKLREQAAHALAFAAAAPQALPLIEEDQV